MKPELYELDDTNLKKIKRIYELENSCLKDVIIIKSRQLSKLTKLYEKYKKKIEKINTEI